MRSEWSVSDLASMLYRQGDIHARLDGSVSAEEGMRAHQQIQRRRQDLFGDGYQSEVAVRAEAGELVLRGRLDGLLRTASGWIVEEYKTTRGDPDALHEHLASVHWAQVTLYAALLDIGDEPLTLRLVYVRPDGDEAARFERTCHRADALAMAFDALGRWSERLQAYRAYVAGRNAALTATDFPFPSYRPNQRALAGTVYAALRDRCSQLLEAPTGSGKSMATLFPAARALADGHAQRLFFLTTRGTGKAAALAAAATLAEAGGELRRIEITAKQKTCFVEGSPCDPERCEYARGYYDRRDEAVVELLSHPQMDREQIESTARTHTVCPFELSLDAAVWCDLVICDYNYLFDPQVRLLRFTGEPDSVVLIDEAHALTERVQAMYSAALDRSALKHAIALAADEHRLDDVGRRLRSIDRAFAPLLKPIPQGGMQAITDDVALESLLRAIARLREALAGEDDKPAPELPEPMAEVVFDCLRFERARGWSEPERYVLHGDRRDSSTLVIRCLDPGPEIRATLDGFAGNVRFSGTLAPLPTTQRLHGYDADDARASSVATPFAPGTIFTAVVTDVPTRYRQREDSLPILADVIADVAAARSGTYLLAMPSYHYLDRVCLELANRHPGLELVSQHPDMDDAQRTEFIARLREPGQDTAQSRIAAVVLGGVMAESVDFADGALAGAIVVTVALPPPDPIRDEMSAYFRRQGLDGYAVSYQRPAMVRAVQAAGRVQRAPDDRGAIVLIDDRFAQPGYRQYLPVHWQPRILSRHALTAELKAFWLSSDAESTQMEPVIGSAQ